MLVFTSVFYCYKTYRSRELKRARTSCVTSLCMSTSLNQKAFLSRSATAKSLLPGKKALTDEPDVKEVIDILYSVQQYQFSIYDMMTQLIYPEAHMQNSFRGILISVLLTAQIAISRLFFPNTINRNDRQREPADPLSSNRLFCLTKRRMADAFVTSELQRKTAAHSEHEKESLFSYALPI